MSKYICAMNWIPSGFVSDFLYIRKGIWDRLRWRPHITLNKNAQRFSSSFFFSTHTDTCTNKCAEKAFESKITKYDFILNSSTNFNFKMIIFFLFKMVKIKLLFSVIDFSFTQFFGTSTILFIEYGVWC